MRLILATSALALLVLSPAVGQSRNDRPGAFGNPAGTEPGTAGPGISAHKANQPDRVFLTMINMGGAAEVEFARLAEQKSQDEQIRNFAQRMIHDHSEADNEIGKLARTDDVHLGDHQLDPDHQQAYDGLTRLAGPGFDI
jgi:putative membrane protein